MTASLFVSGDIEVNSRLFSIGDKSYAIGAITSVGKSRVDKTESWEIHKLVIFVWAIVALFIFLSASECGDGLWIIIPVGGIAYSVYRRFAIKPDIQHVLLITTAAGQVEALASKDEVLISRVHAALIDAMQAR